MNNNKKIKIAIISGPENGSPKVLATTLESFIKSVGHQPKVFFKSKAIKRLNKRCQGCNKVLWWIYRTIHYLNDQLFFIHLRRYNAIVVCDWTPNAFLKGVYDIKKMKILTKGKPILYYAVQYLGNAPTQIEKLKSGGHPLFEKYDWHLSVSEVTEIRQRPAPPWSHIGLYLKGTGLAPVVKEKFIAVVDYAQEGYLNYRKEQIEVLEELGIEYVSLEKKYTIEKIRKYYKSAAIYFMQSAEAFGMPIAECLATGTYIFTPDSSWPMAWRLNENPTVHGPGVLPECFVEYNGKLDLKKKIDTIKNNFDSLNTPKKVFNIFSQYYLSYYQGNAESLKCVIEKIEKKEIG